MVDIVLRYGLYSANLTFVPMRPTIGLVTQSSCFPEAFSPMLAKMLILPAADESTFMAAYNSFWKKKGEAPKCQMTPRLPVNPWVLWREVHAWGGPEVVHDRKVRTGWVRHGVMLQLWEGL